MMTSPSPIPTPKFTRSAIQHVRTDGSWIETFWADPADRYPGVIAYGFEEGQVSVFDNPLNQFWPVEATHSELPGDQGWDQYVITTFDSPVAVAIGDCAGNGRKDIVICHDYGSTFLEPRPDGGHVSWLENPGRNPKTGKLYQIWTKRFIGRWPSMHRLRAGHFTQRSTLEIAALPVMRRAQDTTTPAPMFLFQRDERAIESLEWKRSIIDDENFTFINDCATKSFNDHTGLESMFIASREGVNWLFWENNKWQQSKINQGLPMQPGNPLYGSSSVDVGRVGSDPAGYMITIDPLHGGTVTALVKRKTGKRSYEWVRHVLDVYGTPQQRQHNGDGPGYQVITADFDGDGDDECLVALFGPFPHTGVYYYKAIDLERGLFAKWKVVLMCRNGVDCVIQQVVEEATKRIAVGKFGPGKGLDFATIGYRFPGCTEIKDLAVHLYTHNFQLQASDSQSNILSTVWGGKPLYYVPKPTDILTPKVAPLIEVADYHITLEVFPQHYQTVVPPEATLDAIKVIWGQIYNNKAPRRALGVPRFQKADSKLECGILETKGEGAILLRFKRIFLVDDISKDDQRSPAREILPLEKGWPTAEEIPVNNLFQFTHPQIQLENPLKFIRVDKLDWACGGFKDLLFYNLSGIHFRFLDDTPICHVQFWTAVFANGYGYKAKDVSAGAHNHLQDFFLEVHLSLWTATREGGMWSVIPGTEIPDPPESLPPSAYTKIPLKSLEHHGPLWDQEPDGRPVSTPNSAVQYPYHKWQAGDEGTNIDIWAAFEFNPDLAMSLQ